MKEIENGPKHVVKVSVGYTKNMGNFESLRVDIGLEIEGQGNPSVTFDKAYAWAENKLVEKMAEVEDSLKEQ